MDISRGDYWWQLEVEIYNPHLRRTALLAERCGDHATVTLALAAVITGLATLVYPWLWPLRLSLSVLTLVSAMVVVTRVATLEAPTTALQLTFPSPSIKNECPDCNEELSGNPDVCLNCGWQSDNSPNR